MVKSDNGKPLKDVSVAVYHSIAKKKEKVTITTALGNYLLIDLKAWISYKLVFEKEGCQKVVKEKILLKANEIFSLNIVMPEEEVVDLMPSPNHFYGD